MPPGALQIRPVQSERDLLAFIRLPWAVNAGDAHWVPPLVQDKRKQLDRARNPFFRDNPAEFFLAWQGGRPAGRVAAILNRAHNRRHGDRAGFFGYLDTLPDPAICAALLEQAEDWLRRQGCDRLVGPVCPDTNNELGVLLDGFDSPPFFMLAHNPPYYDALLAGLGYRKARDFYSYFISPESFAGGGKLARVGRAIMRRYPLTLRPANMRRFDADLQTLGEIYNDAFARHWGFVPMTPAEFQFMAADLRLIVDPELVLFAEFAGEPAGFLLAVPNINEILQGIPDGQLYPFGWLKFLLDRRKVKGVRVLTLAVRQKYQPFGLGAVFYAEIARRIVARGYTHAEMSWVVEDNLVMNRAARLIGGRVYKTYRVYEKEL